MLLTEIISTYHDNNNTTSVVPDWAATDTFVPAGIKYISLPRKFQKEELAAIEKSGIHPVSTIPVFFAFQLEKTSRNNQDQYKRMIQLMDALKRRNQQEVTISDDDYHAVHTQAVNRLLGKSSKRWLNKVAPTEQTDLMIKLSALKRTLTNNKNDVVLVPIASSSTAVKDFSNELATQLGLKTQPLNVLVKNHWPTQSAHVRTNSGFTPRENNQQNWAEQKAQLQARIQAIDVELEKLNKLNPTSDREINNLVKSIDDLELERKRLSNQLDRHKFEIKSAGHGQPDHNRGYYDYQHLDDTKIDQANTLSGKIVVLVDDNIDSGATIADAAKTLYRAGIVPKQIIGVVVHYFKPPPATIT